MKDHIKNVTSKSGVDKPPNLITPPPESLPSSEHQRIKDDGVMLPHTSRWVNRKTINVEPINMVTIILHDSYVKYSFNSFSLRPACETMASPTESASCDDLWPFPFPSECKEAPDEILGKHVNSYGGS